MGEGSGRILRKREGGGGGSSHEHSILNKRFSVVEAQHLKTVVWLIFFGGWGGVGWVGGRGEGKGEEGGRGGRRGGGKFISIPS